MNKEKRKTERLSKPVKAVFADWEKRTKYRKKCFRGNKNMKIAIIAEKILRHGTTIFELGIKV